MTAATTMHLTPSHPTSSFSSPVALRLHNVVVVLLLAVLVLLAVLLLVTTERMR